MLSSSVWNLSDCGFVPAHNVKACFRWDRSWDASAPRASLDSGPVCLWRRVCPIERGVDRSRERRLCGACGRCSRRTACYCCRLHRIVGVPQAIIIVARSRCRGAGCDCIRLQSIDGESRLWRSRHARLQCRCLT